MRAALYARVSTHDQQTLGLQSEAMRSYIRDRGWDAVKQVKDVGSGARERPGRDGLLKAARRREVDVVVVWRLDRWGRSLPDLMVTLRELTNLGVGFVSLTEALDLPADSRHLDLYRAHTYLSDRAFIGRGIGRVNWGSASLDHAIWFHRPPRFDDWVLYTSESPVAHAARALILGEMYTTDGTRIASVAQEGLIRTPRQTMPGGDG